MNFIKKNKWKIIGISLTVLLLAISFFLPETQDRKTEQKATVAIEDISLKDFDKRINPEEPEKISETAKPEEPEQTQVPTKAEETENSQTPAKTTEPEKSQKPLQAGDPVKTQKPEKAKQPLQTEEPHGEKVIVEQDEGAKVQEPERTQPPQKVEERKEVPTCTITVRCDTALKNIKNMKPEKISIVPQNGVILSQTKTEFTKGDTVFDILKEELKKNKIHLEFQGTTVYDSVYIEGIGNLYEFDCGNLSGWVYRVNGKVPSVGCSSYEVKEGDNIEFLYTCNMGRDL